MNGMRNRRKLFRHASEIKFFQIGIGHEKNGTVFQGSDEQNIQLVQQPDSDENRIGALRQFHIYSIHRFLQIIGVRQPCIPMKLLCL